MRSKKIEKYKARLKLNTAQKEILFGIMLGDATLETQNKGRTYRLKIEHSIGQKAYVEHLYGVFRMWVLSKPRFRKISLPNGKRYTAVTFSTVSHPNFRFYAHQFYRNGRKVVPKLIARWLTPRTLAYWFMDDGSVKSKESKAVIFNTQGFGKEDVDRLAGAVSRRFSLEAKPRRQKEGYQIYVSGRNYERFKELVLPHMLPEMTYKIPEARRTHLPKA